MLHTLNLRLHPHEIALIANHARDRFLLVDDVLLPLFEKFKTRKSWSACCGGPTEAALPRAWKFNEELLATARGDFKYPRVDENEAAAMCFTSGTTGNSKGVITRTAR